MSRPNSKEDRLANWGDLVENARENEAQLPGAAPLIESLATAHHQVLMLSGRRDSLLAAAQELTPQVNRAMAEGADAAIRLRHFIKVVLGIHTEELLRYGIRPVRNRSRNQRGCGSPG